MTEQAVLGAAANHMDGAVILAGAVLQLLVGIAVFHCQAFIDAPHHLAYGFGDRLTGFFTKFPHSAGKIARRNKHRIVRIDKAGKGLFTQRQPFQVAIAVVKALPLVLTAALLDHPKAQDIPNQGGFSLGGALVGQIVPYCLLVQDRTVYHSAEN